MTYRPRRASKKWLDGDCPDGVLAIFDDPRTPDRYTIFYRDVIEYPGHVPVINYRGCSADPFAPHGIAVYDGLYAHAVAEYRHENYPYSCKWTDLPHDVQVLVRSDLAEE